MNFKDELCAIKRRTFTPQLRETLLEAYKAEAKDTSVMTEEGDYAEDIKALLPMLNEKEKATLDAVEAKYMQGVELAVSAGYERGIFAGFQQLFSEQPCQRPFKELVVDCVLRENRSQEYEVYREIMGEAELLLMEFREQLNSSAANRLKSIEDAWDERIYGVLRHSFYLGYRYALEIIGKIIPIGHKADMTGKILLTEYELGFIKTKEESERFDLNLLRLLSIRTKNRKTAEYE